MTTNKRPIGIATNKSAKVADLQLAAAKGSAIYAVAPVIFLLYNYRKTLLCDLPKFY
jgi:hypothetical protein